MRVLGTSLGLLSVLAAALCAGCSVDAETNEPDPLPSCGSVDFDGKTGLRAVQTGEASVVYDDHGPLCREPSTKPKAQTGGTSGLYS